MIEQLNDNSHVIGKLGDYYLVTNNPTATLEDILEYAFVVDKNGKIMSHSVSIDFYTRKEVWEPVNGIYSQYISLPKRDIVRDGLFGLAVGDALGVPVEFLDRKTVRDINVTEMMGVEDKLTFRSRWSQMIPSGSWSDDTSMTIATMDTISKDKGEINYDHIMDSFLDWWFNKKYTSLDIPFGLGGVVTKALYNYRRGMPTLVCGGSRLYDNGNGSLMRILPFSLYCIENELDEEETVSIIKKASSLTHAHYISIMSCFIYTEFLRCLIATRNPKLAHSYICSIDYSKYFTQEAIDALNRLIRRDFPYVVSDSDISEENGYVVSTLESSIYSILHSKNYEEAVEKAINMGYDTDTIGAVTGSLAGILYGYDDIPERWLHKLRKKEELDIIADSYNEMLKNTKNHLLNENSQNIEKNKISNI